jgi:hypothetical protein
MLIERDDIANICHWWSPTQAVACFWPHRIAPSSCPARKVFVIFRHLGIRGLEFHYTSRQNVRESPGVAEQHSLFGISGHENDKM